MDIEKYFELLRQIVDREYILATQAKIRGLDPHLSVEPKITINTAERVEFMCKINGVAQYLLKLQQEGYDRYKMAFHLINYIFETSKETHREITARKALVGAVALITEGVVAVDEGIEATKVIQNPDGTEYLKIIFAGPSRSFGGTPLAMSLIFADYIRLILGLDKYKPTIQEINRLIEETHLYPGKQYLASDAEVMLVAENCPVQFTSGPGLSTRKVEVNRNLPRIDDIAMNYVREPTMILLLEGILLKAHKLKKLLNTILKEILPPPVLDDWNWIEKVVELQDKIHGGETEAHSDMYLQQIVTGRPVYSLYNKEGGFAFTLGKGRTTGLNATAIHPATVFLLNGYPAFCTQMKISYPGKATVVTTCDEVDPPVVKLEDGSVLKVTSVSQAKELAPKISQVLFLGGLLISAGDIIENGKPVLPPAFDINYWSLLLKSKNPPEKDGEYLFNKASPPVEVAFEISERYNIPLHPEWTFQYSWITDVNNLIKLSTLIQQSDKNIPLPMDIKQTLEEALIPHTVIQNQVILDEKIWKALKLTFRYPVKVPVSNPLEYVNRSSGVIIRDKYPTIVGARMGRTPNAPDKWPRRLDKKIISGLIPLSDAVGGSRLISKAYALDKISVEVMVYQCPSCNTVMVFRRCPDCDVICQPVGTKGTKRAISAQEIVQKACKLLNENPEEVLKLPMKGVKGVYNVTKTIEHPAKAILRAKHGLGVFKDGTIVLDITLLPLTHFRPSECNTDIDTLKKFGYTHDIYGAPLENEDQIVELLPQDAIIPEESLPFLMNIAKFVDEELVKLYHLQPYYNVSDSKELISQGLLIVNLAPHTVAGVVQRVIGTWKGRGICCHPIVISTTRRDADGDSNQISLLLDVFINQSREYLVEERPGALMGTPLYIITKVNVEEADLQIKSVDTCNMYPLEIYEGKVVPYDSIGYRMSSGINLYNQYRFTHNTKNINEGEVISRYIYSEEHKKKKSMVEKESDATETMKKLRAVDLKLITRNILYYHLLKDIRNNLINFASQSFRCTKCNNRITRPPLDNKCPKCGQGNIIQTIYYGGICKYLQLAEELANKINDIQMISDVNHIKSILRIYFSEKEQEPGLEKWLEISEEEETGGEEDVE